MYDHAQSARIAQRTGPDNPGIQLVSSVSLPEVAYRGQMVYAVDTRTILVFNGVAWDTAGGSAFAQTFVGANEPVADAVGDLWLNTADYQLYVWDGDIWQRTTSNEDRLRANSSVALVAAIRRYPGGHNAHVVVFYGPTPPIEGYVQKDFWVNTVTNIAFQRIQESWVENTDPTLNRDFNLAGYARYTMDGMIEVYFDSTPPMGLSLTDIGDIWVDTDNSSLVHGWSGAAWIPLQVSRIDIADGAVGGDQLGEEAVDSRHVVSGATNTEHLADFAVGTNNIQDFAIAARKFDSLNHLIY